VVEERINDRRGWIFEFWARLYSFSVARSVVVFNGNWRSSGQRELVMAEAG
jgi:hypothetical protein